MKYSHPLWHTLRSLKGNQRACVLTEPLWAIPYNLFLPFASIYMATIGLQDRQIGIIVSFGLAMQLIWGVFSGAIVNKYGRRNIMLVFGLLSWSVPCLLWAGARSFLFFLAAVFFNSMLQVINNCFSCLIVEDGETSKMVHIWTILNMIGLLAGLISPITGFFIGRFSLVPTMRFMYLFSMVLMSMKFLLQYKMSAESGEGKRCVENYKDEHLLHMAFGGLGESLSSLLKPKLLLCVLLGAIMTCFNNVQAAFWPLFVTKAYHVNTAMLSVFPFVASITSLVVYLLITPRLKLRSIKYPLLGGMLMHLLGVSSLLIFLPGTSLGVVFFSAVCEAFALALLAPLFEAMMSIVIPAAGRAQINSLIFAVMMLIGTPAGWAAGYLSQQNRSLPMVMNLCIIFIGLIVSLYIIKIFQPQQEVRN